MSDEQFEPARENKNGWGGARAGAGRPRMPVDERAIKRLREAGYSITFISKRLGLGRQTISRVLRETIAERPLIK